MQMHIIRLQANMTGHYADSSYIKTTGFSLALGKQLKWPDDYFSLVYQLDYQRYKLKKYNIFPGLTNGISNNVSLKITLARNSAGPNPIFPTSGSNFILSTAIYSAIFIVQKCSVL